jgi:hypothetical protein
VKIYERKEFTPVFQVSQEISGNEGLVIQDAWIVGGIEAVCFVGERAAGKREGIETIDALRISHTSMEAHEKPIFL